MLVAARKGLGKLHLNGRWIEMLEINWFEEVIQKLVKQNIFRLFNFTL